MPNVSIAVKISGLNIVPECINVELAAVLTSNSLYPIYFTWNIQFVSVPNVVSIYDRQAAIDYFQNFIALSSTAVVIIPNKYYIAGTILYVKVWAATDKGLGLTSASTTVFIVGSMPTIKFSANSQFPHLFPGVGSTMLPVLLGLKKCTNSTTTFQVNFNFSLYSGSTTSPTKQGASEYAIQNTLTSDFANYQALCLSLSQGFSYNTYYKLIMTITDKSTNVATNDIMIFAFYKPSITAIIDPIGNIVNIYNDVYLYGHNSLLPESTGDLVQYIWKCENVISFKINTTCSCPIMGDTALNYYQLLIPSYKLQNLCKYTYTLTVIAQSSSGYNRTSTTTTEFLGFLGALPYVSVTVTPDALEQSVVFSFSSTLSVPDNQTFYEWKLIQMTSLSNQYSLNYSEKNTFIYNYLTYSNISADNSTKSADIPVPVGYIPQNLTSMTARILAIGTQSLFENTLYVYGVTVKYPTTQTFAFASYLYPAKPQKRYLIVQPDSGIAMKTVFSIMFSMNQTTGVDNAQYQIFRRDCTTIGQQATPVTTVLGYVNSYTTVLSPGNVQCNYQVDIILRAIENGLFQETSYTITITNQNVTIDSVFANTLASLKANIAILVPNQILSTITELSNIRLTESTAIGHQGIYTMIDLITREDSPNGVRTLIYETDLPAFLNITASAMGKLLQTQIVNVEPAAAANISSKISNYLTAVNGLSGGINIIGTCTNTLSGVAEVGRNYQSNKTYFTNMHSVVNQMVNMKKIVQTAEAPAFLVTSNRIDLLVKSNYIYSFISSQQFVTDKGSIMGLPDNLQNAFRNIIQNYIVCQNNTLTIVTTIAGIHYNPLSDIKTRVKLNISFLSNLATSILDPSVILQIYADLAAGKLTDAVNITDQSTDILETSFTFYEIDMAGNLANSMPPFTVSQLPNGTLLNWTLTTNTVPDNLIVIPFYYVSDTDRWSNQGCVYVKSGAPYFVNASCIQGNQSLQTNATKGTTNNAYRFSMDMLSDLSTILYAGNYYGLFRFGKDPAWIGYIVVIGIAFLLFLSLCFAVILYKGDRLLVFEERITTLYERYEDYWKEDSEGFMKRIYVFFANLKKKGMEKVAKEEQKMFNLEDERGILDIYKLWPNGFTVLTNREEKKLRNCYKNYNEHIKVFSNGKLCEILYNEISSEPIITRLTQSRLTDFMATQTPTCFRILKVMRCI